MNLFDSKKKLGIAGGIFTPYYGVGIRCMA